MNERYPATVAAELLALGLLGTATAPRSSEDKPTRSTAKRAPEAGRQHLHLDLRSAGSFESSYSIPTLLRPVVIVYLCVDFGGC